MQCPRCGRLLPEDGDACDRCGARWARDSAAPGPAVGISSGQVLDRQYRIDGLIGRGGMAEVYGATDLRLDRRVALKILSSELMHHPTARARMEREAIQLAKVNHPNVVPIYNVFDYQGLLVLVLELAEGGSVEGLIPKGGNTYKAVAPVVDQILAGVGAVHAIGLVHRDIKPANVLVTRDGVCRLADLGVVRDPSRQKTKTGAVLGTPAYMSPEQIRGLKDVDHRSDIYSCGVLIYELICGVVPFAKDSEFDLMAAHVNEPPDLARLAGRAPDHVIAAIGKALAKSPGDRWQSAAELQAALHGKAPVASKSIDRSRAPTTDAQPANAAPRPVWPSPTPEARSFISAIGNMGTAKTLSYVYLGAWVLALMCFILLVAADAARADDAAGAFSLLFFLLLILLPFLRFAWVYHSWAALPEGLRARSDGTPVSPWGAVGWHFVPFYNLYWMFAQRSWLCDGLDRLARELELPRTAPRGLGIGSNILSLIPYVGMLADPFHFGFMISVSSMFEALQRAEREHGTPISSTLLQPSSGFGQRAAPVGADRYLLPVGRSAWAIAAGYLGLVALFFWFFGPIAIIVSIIAIWHIRQSESVANEASPAKLGMGRAVFGLIVGLLSTGLLVVIAAS